MKSRYPEYQRVKCYNGTSVRLRIIGCIAKNYQQGHARTVKHGMVVADVRHHKAIVGEQWR
jgi:hypothetical protein